jgi:hypothetical protein
MTSSIDRSASERIFSNQSYEKTGEELKALIHRQNEVDPYIKVRKSSIKRLRNWATQRQAEQRRELREPQASYAEVSWNGYILALDHVFEMEDA